MLFKNIFLLTRNLQPLYLLSNMTEKADILKNSSLTCWVVTEGIAGTENQCIGLAEALGIDSPSIKRVNLRLPWKLTSPYIRIGGHLGVTGDALSPPWPDIVIASGRKSIQAALFIKKASGGKTFLVQIQDPRISPDHFDLVIVPQHDPTRGENVLVTTGSLNRITKEKLAAAAQDFAHLKDLPSPRVAVLIGGNSKAHRLTENAVRLLTAQLKSLAQENKAQLLITASRRTGAENADILRRELTPIAAEFWDGTGKNPYFGYLATADYILVTEDSVSMTSEALATGKPVMVIPLEGGAKRLNRFHQLLRDQGYTKPFTGQLETWSYTPPDDTDKAATEILKRLQKTTNGKDI